MALFESIHAVLPPWFLSPRYVAGNADALVNCLLLLDGFWVRALKDETPIHIFPHTGIDLKSLMEDLFS